MWLIVLRKHACNGILPVSVSITKSQQLKISTWNMSKIYSLSLEKGVVRILADFFKQRFNKLIVKIMIHGRNALPGFKLAQNFREKWLLPPGNLGRSLLSLGRSGFGRTSRDVKRQTTELCHTIYSLKPSALMSYYKDTIQYLFASS